jgi:citrate synthase
MTAPTTEKETYSPGLEGVIAGETAVSTLAGGLSYRGYPVEELAAQASYEEVAYLILHGELPNQTQLDAFQSRLAEQAFIPCEILSVLGKLPPATSMMDAMRSACSLLAHWDPEVSDNSHDANVRKTERLVAKLPVVLAARHRLRRGLTPIRADPQRSFAGNLLWMLHGGANERVMEVIEEVGSPDRAESWVRDALANKRRIMGFGHRVYRTGDPRATILKPWCTQLAAETNNIALEKIADILEQHVRKEKNLPPNVDWPCGRLYHYLGLPIDLYTPLFVVARTVGWCAHVIEQLDDNRLMRPRSLYVGPAVRKWKPMDKR